MQLDDLKLGQTDFLRAERSNSEKSATYFDAFAPQRKMEDEVNSGEATKPSKSACQSC